MKYVLIGAVGLALFMAACSPPSGPAQSETENKTRTPEQVDSLLRLITAARDSAEASLSGLKQVQLPTDSLRPQIRQKWSRLDFYLNGDQVVRIRTYPHNGISQRTEEFYFRDGRLALAFVEDDGLPSEGAAAGRKGKTYYFFEEEVIHEENNSGEKETAIRQSDAERLLQEANEYMDILKEQTK